MTWSSYDDLRPHQSEAENFYAKYDLKEILGTGVSSTVRRCIEKSSKTEYAVKTLDLNGGPDSPELIRADAHREIDILRRVKGHPNIIQLIDMCETEAYIFLIFELCRGGELFDHLTDVVTLSEKATRSIMYQLLDAVGFIHRAGIVHRDLKPENILLGENLRIKVADFGLAVLSTDVEELTETRGTPGYLAPEALRAGYFQDEPPYGQPVDLWACGVIMYTLLVGFPPFWNRKEYLMLRQIMEGNYSFHSPEWDDTSDASKKLIRQLLTVDHSSRINAQVAIEHPFFFRKAPTNGVINGKSPRTKLKTLGTTVCFILRLQRLRRQSSMTSSTRAAKDPYSCRRFRKLIDSVAFTVYSHWVKKGENQNRAALFETHPRRDWLQEINILDVPSSSSNGDCVEPLSI